MGMLTSRLRLPGRAVRAVLIGLAALVALGIASTIPLTTADQATSVALSYQVGPAPNAWRAVSRSLSFDGNRPRLGNLAPANEPRCFGFGLPLGSSFCLPYPMWKVHLVGPVAAPDCNESLVYVDARRARVVLLMQETGRCGAFPPSA